MKWINQYQYAVIDTETTGVDTQTARILNLAVRLYDGKNLVNIRSYWCLPGVEIPAEAVAVHGITEEKLLQHNAQPFEAYAPELAKLLHDRVLVGYNLLGYDLPLLLAEFDRCVLAGEALEHVTDLRFKDHVIDGLPWVWALDRYVRGKGRHKLTNTLLRWGRITAKEAEAAHDAVADAAFAWQIFENLAVKMRSHRHPQRWKLSIENFGKFLDLQRALHVEREQEWADYKKSLDEQQKRAQELSDGLDGSTP